MDTRQSITSLPDSPEEDRRKRVVRYSIAMSVRVACVIAAFFAQGWWLLLFVSGAVILPYIAVVLANVGSKDGDPVVRPDAALAIAAAPEPADRTSDK